VLATSEKDSEKLANLYSRYLYDWLLVAIALLCFLYKSYAVNVRHIEYFKLVFLKYINVSTWSVFAGLVIASTDTFVMCIVISPLIHEKSVLFKYRLIVKGIPDPNCVATLVLAYKACYLGFKSPVVSLKFFLYLV